MTMYKRQHIIPQHYLKGFSEDRDDHTKSTGDKIIYFHNIKNEKRHKTVIRNIGFENYFYGKEELYEINNLDGKNKSNCKSLEEVLNRFETEHDKLLSQIIAYKNLCLSQDQMLSLYYFFTLLKTRTKKSRDYAVKSKKVL